MTVNKESTIDLIKKLSDQGVKVNVTAIYTIDQVKDTVNEALDPNVGGYVSVFAGRISDSWYDHMPIMEEAKNYVEGKRKNWIIMGFYKRSLQYIPSWSIRWIL